MFRAVLQMRIKPGFEEMFEKTWTEAAYEISNLPGNIGQTLARISTDAASYVITSDWSDAVSLRHFEGSTQRRALSAELELLRDTAVKSTQEVLVQINGTEQQ